MKYLLLALCIAGCGGARLPDQDRIVGLARRDLDCPVRYGTHHEAIDDLDVHEERMHHWIARCGDRSRRYVCQGLHCAPDVPRQNETLEWTRTGALECTASGPDVDRAQLAFDAMTAMADDVIACGARSFVASVDPSDGWIYLDVLQEAPQDARPCVASALARVHVMPPLGSELRLACRIP